MRKAYPVIVIAVVGFFAYQKYHRATLAAQPPDPIESVAAEEEAESPAVERDNQYRCDGRTRCSQFNTCEEATWFIENCPGMKMDGDNDGVPCESHLCPHS